MSPSVAGECETVRSIGRRSAKRRTSHRAWSSSVSLLLQVQPPSPAFGASYSLAVHNMDTLHVAGRPLSSAARPICWDKVFCGTPHPYLRSSRCAPAKEWTVGRLSARLLERAKVWKSCERPLQPVQLMHLTARCLTSSSSARKCLVGARCTVKVNEVAIG